jgi:hypothetical protein
MGSKHPNRIVKDTFAMKTSVSHLRRSGFYTVREAAWILGVDPATVCRASRTGALPTVRRRSRLVVPAHALVRLLDQPAAHSPPTVIGQGGGGEAR